MNNKKILIISIFSMLTVIILIIGIILFSVNQKAKTLEENIILIKSNYANFSTSLLDNTEIKTKISNKLSTINESTYEEEYGSLIETLRKYDKNIQYIDTIIKDIAKKCEYDYEDKTVQILCAGYGELYEEIINKYITNINTCNEKINKLNAVIEEPYNLHKPIYEEYIDYDKDGKYEGK